MSAGPLRRVAAAIGLVALGPIAAMLVQGALTPEEAAQRAVVVGLVVIVLGNAARRVVTGVLLRVERRSEDAVAPPRTGAERRVDTGR